MLIEQALMTYLLAQATVTAEVSTRIYFVEAPQDAVQPYMVIQKIDSIREHSHDGSSQLAHARFQFTVFANKYSDCKDAIAALQGVLQGYTGTMGGDSGVAVGNSIYENETDLERDEQGLYGVAADYIIWHVDT